MRSQREQNQSNLNVGFLQPDQPAVLTSLRNAAQRIAPAWHAHNYVAVNPLFGLRDLPFQDAILYSEAATGSRLLPPSSFFRTQLQQGRITDQDIYFAINQARFSQKGQENTFLEKKDLLRTLNQESSKRARTLHCISDLASAADDVDYSSAVQQEISKWLSVYFDEAQSTWKMPYKHLPVYNAWLSLVCFDQILDRRQIRLQALVSKLSSNPQKAILSLSKEIERHGELSAKQWEHYFYRLFCSCLGWASFLSAKDFERNRGSQNPDSHYWLEQFIAIRMAYDVCFLSKLPNPKAIPQSLNLNSRSDRETLALHVWLLAHEHSYRRRLQTSIATKTEALVAACKPKAQLCFCIDVRSERVRRHIENTDTSLQTIGFAGFFGLPMSYKPIGSNQEIQHCPVLVEPSFCVEESAPNHEHAQSKIQLKASQSRLKIQAQSSPNSCFSFVETLWVPYLIKLIRAASGFVKPDLLSLKTAFPKDLEFNTPGMSLTERTSLVANALKGMGLTEQFAPLVVLFGHESESANNPHASGLDCGACAGRSGLPNAQVLCTFLNDQEVRTQLGENHGLEIPSGTLFLAGVHNTTKDTFYIQRISQLNGTHETLLRELEDALLLAGKRTRLERASLLSFCEGRTETQIEEELEQRASDWSEIRPEWGLAGNASFIVARRARTARLDLNGRAFLHEYDPFQDEDGRILEQIVTAPMVVTNWINMQYYASALDPDFFGAGDKALHNVVSSLGVIEGGAGDLKVGLSRQSVQRSGEFVHEPIRLQVVIEAPTARIAQIIKKHELVEQLVSNKWLSILALDPESSAMSLYESGGWLDL